MKKYIVFALGGENFGIEISRVVEVLKAGDVIVVPDLPDYISGVMTVRGEVVPLMDMRKRFGVVPSGGKHRTLLVRAGGEKVGLLMDKVEGITDFNEGEITAPPSIFMGLKAEYLEGIGKRRDNVVILLDLDNLITSREMILLETARESVRGAQT
jgi:purine-binding chemotaxis protein CheW